MPGFMSLLVALVLIEAGAKVEPDLSGALWSALAVVGMVFVFGEVMGGVVCGWSRRQGATPGLRKLMVGWDMAAQGLITAGFAWICLEDGWVTVSGSYSVAILPWVVMMCVHWYCVAGGLRALGDSWCRAGFVWQQVRIGILPMVIIMPLLDLGPFLVRTCGLDGWWFQGGMGMVLNTLGSLAAVAVLVVLAPALLIRIWGARSLPEGPGRELVQDCCRRTGVIVGGILSWPTPGGRHYNAAAIGLLPRWRWVLVTEDLLRDFPAEQVTAVVGHELGHVRHHHLLFYMMVLMCLATAAGHVSPYLSTLPPLSELPAVEGNAVALILVILIGIRLGFGPISRACERQADLAGASCAGNGDVAAGAGAMAGALKTVALLSGQPENAPSWRHRSIAARVAFLERVARMPSLAADHHRSVRSMRFTVITLLIGLGLSLMIQGFFHPLRGALTADDPGQVLSKDLADYPDLAAAMTSADSGDTGALIFALRKAPPEVRQRIAVTLYRIPETGSPSLGIPANDIRAMYRLRYRLSAFTNVVTDDPGIDGLIDNLTAYVLVAATESPSAGDLAIARSILPRLERGLQKPFSGDHAIWDTVGCVHARSGDWRAAHNAFAQAGSRLKATGNEAERNAVGDLYHRRLAAAETALATGATRLPLEWDLAGPATAAVSVSASRSLAPVEAAAP